MDMFEVRSSGTRVRGRPAALDEAAGPRPLGRGGVLADQRRPLDDPVAAGYRSALSIPYVPMLLEAAAGVLVVAGPVALLVAQFPDRVPGSGPLRKAMLLAVGALVLLTVLVEVPSKLLSGVADPGHWLLVATVFNAIRLVALGVTIGLITRGRTTRQGRHNLATRREAQS